MPGLRSVTGSASGPPRRAAFRRSGLHLDRHGDEAMRRHHLLDQMAQGQPRHDQVVLLAAARELGQDVTAALGLRAQQHQILVVLVGRLRVAHQLLGHHRDGRQRRAESMRGRRGQTVERRELLLARQHHLGGGQRLGHAPRFLGGAPGIEADEQDSRHERRPHPHHIGERQQQVGVMEPGQRVVKSASAASPRRWRARRARP